MNNSSNLRFEKIIFFITTNWVSAQCTAYSSPEILCTAVDPLTGDVLVSLDQTVMGGPAPTDITQIELFFKTTIGGAWTSATISPGNPNTITHVLANQNNSSDAFYMVQATCAGAPVVPLNESQTVQVIKLKSTTTNDFEVNLSWNWDLLMGGTNIINNIQRLYPITSLPAFLASPTFSQSTGTYTDTVVTCKDSVGYFLLVFWY